MARIKYVLNERRLALIAAAESSRPSNERSKIMGRSPLGRVDPLAVNGWEDGIADRLAAPLPASLDDVAVVNTVDASELESPLGDGERQKRDVVTEVDEGSATVEDAEVAKQEVEGRDEGFGGGQEAKEFVKDMERKGL
jgi:large subunit ribosomal protein L47